MMAVNAGKLVIRDHKKEEMEQEADVFLPANMKEGKGARRKK
jgi:hypothetical protein